MRGLLALGGILLLLGVAVPLPAAVDCDGADDFLAGVALSNYLTVTDFTLAVWFTGAGTSPTDSDFCTSVPNSQYVIGNASGSTVRVHVTRHSATEVCGLHRDTTPLTVSITGTHTDQTPAHVVLVHTGGTVAMYIQGVLVDTPVSSGNTNALTNILRVCGSAGFTSFNGRLEALTLYNTAVPSGEIATLAQSRRTEIFKTTPTARWTFDNCADGMSADGVSIRDLSGNGRTLTGDNGANNTGLTCRASTLLGRWGGIQ